MISIFIARNKYPQLCCGLVSWTGEFPAKYEVCP